MRTIMKTMLKAGLIAILTVMATPAIAQESGGNEADGEGDEPKKKVYDFEGDNVTGELVKPTGENVQAEQHGKTSNLIDIRSDFVPEMLETVEEL